MTRRIFTDRSRVEQFQRCNRSRWLAYHEQGRGIQSAKKPLALCVGGSVHVGLETLLTAFIGKTIFQGEDAVELEDTAVADALADFAIHADALEIDTFESAAMTIPDAPVETFGMPLSQPTDDERVAAQRQVEDTFGRYLREEQAALVEAMVRAYARRRLRPLLEQFEVLEVEREGEWPLGTVLGKVCDCGLAWGSQTHMKSCQRYKDASEIMFMSRPDALLRERDSNQLYLLSYKTAASWDIRKSRDAEHDMQGLSEGVDVERRLGEWWHRMRDTGDPESRRAQWVKLLTDTHESIKLEVKPDSSVAMVNYLASLDAPPRIHAIRYEYLLKGSRRRDTELSQRLGVDAYSQASHLVRQYTAVSVPMRGAAAYAIGDVCWSWEYTRVEDQREGKLAWQNWRPRPVWEQPGGVRAWIDQLDASAPLMSGEDSTIGIEPSQVGWSGPAQSLGVTKEHPLDQVFLPPVVVYRSDDDLRDWIEQVESQERRVAESVAVVAAASMDEGERRHLLNIYFVQNRHACEYPGTCQFVKVCYGGDDMRRDPLGSGKFKPREINHPQELEGAK